VEYENSRDEATARLIPIVRLSELDTAPPARLLLDRLDPEAATILYGPGGVGKGALTSSWIVRLAQLGHHVLILDYEDHPREWARRITSLGGASVARDVHHIAPLSAGLGTLPKAAKELQAAVAAWGFDYVVVDSALIAAGAADGMKPDSAEAYFTALQTLRVPSLTLGHVTKLLDGRYPFGSVYWHNYTRMSWSLMPKGGETILTCAKHSNYPPQSAASIEMTWHEGRLVNVHERRASQTLLDRIITELAGGPMSPIEIANHLNDGLPQNEKVKRQAIAAVLSRELKSRATSSRVTSSGAGLWKLRSEGDDQ
jgi:hypothetical protein